jgi:hypothetical protein
MARRGRPERNRAARSFHQLRRFHHGSNSDAVFGTHRDPKPGHRPVERRHDHQNPGPARAEEHRQISLYFPIKCWPKAAQAKQCPKDRAKESFAPRSCRLRRTEQAEDICFLQPQIAQMIDREIVRERARQNNAAGRGARYAIDDDPQIENPSDRL